MLGNITGTDSQHKHGYSWQHTKSPTKTCLVRPRSELDKDEEKEKRDQTINPGTNINKKHSSSPGGGPSPAKKRRLNEEDLIAREELDSNDDDWEANDRFDVISHIGDGTYGVVYKAIDRDRHNQLVAVKKIRFQLDHYGHMPNCVVREIANLKYLHRYTDSFNVPIIRSVEIRSNSDIRHMYKCSHVQVFMCVCSVYVVYRARVCVCVCARVLRVDIFNDSLSCVMIMKVI